MTLYSTQKETQLHIAFQLDTYSTPLTLLPTYPIQNLTKLLIETIK